MTLCDWPESYCLIYLKDQIIGYTNTNREAHALCKIDYRYQWDYNNRVKNSLDLYNILPQLVLSNGKIIKIYSTTNKKKKKI